MYQAKREGRDQVKLSLVAAVTESIPQDAIA
jgi:hypothetical protein